MPLREMAVLFRAGYMSADLEIELTNRKIPFEKWGGLKFLEAAHVKDVLAFLRVLENPRDEVSWYRILHAAARHRRRDGARGDRRDGRARAWDPRRVRALSRRRARARERTRALVALLRQLRGARASTARAPSVGRATSRASAQLYDDILRERVRSRRAAAGRSRSAADDRRRLSRSRATFLSALALEPPQATQDLAGGDRRAKTTRSS